MSRSNPLVLFAVLVAFGAAVAAVSLTKGGLYISRHEGDVLHLLDILFRLERGELPHIDFMTPIGAFAFLPIHAFMLRGMGVDQAFLWGQVAAALLLLPAVWWAAYSRFPGLLAYGFGLACLVLALALVHGEALNFVSLSMHYNRWAWALAFVAVALSFLRPLGRPRPLLDGLLIGLCGGSLVMIKVTYAVAFAPPVLIALLLRHDRQAVLAAMLGVLAVATGVSLWGGLGYWSAYVGDLLFVARSEIRPSPSLDLAGTLVFPAYLAGTIGAVAGVILLRRAGAEQPGLFALLVLPAFAYATYQNFGNDPQWWLIFGLLLLVWRTEVDAQTAPRATQALSYLAVLFVALAAPSYINLVHSPFAHAAADPDDHASLLPRSERHSGLQTRANRANRINGSIPMSRLAPGLAVYDTLSERPDPLVFLGETLPRCELALGLPGMLDAVGTDLVEAGYGEDARIMPADVLSALWIFTGAEPLEGGAPWYYGGLPGWENAEYLLVPLCPSIEEVRADILELVETSGVTLEEVRRTPLYILFSKT